MNDTDIKTIEIEEMCPECDSFLDVHIEPREAGHAEEIAFCKNCGYMETIML